MGFSWSVEKRLVWIIQVQNILKLKIIKLNKIKTKVKKNRKKSINNNKNKETTNKPNLITILPLLILELRRAPSFTTNIDIFHTLVHCCERAIFYTFCVNHFQLTFL